MMPVSFDSSIASDLVFTLTKNNRINSYNLSEYLRINSSCIQTLIDTQSMLVRYYIYQQILVVNLIYSLLLAEFLFLLLLWFNLAVDLLFDTFTLFYSYSNIVPLNFYGIWIFTFI